MRYVILGKGGHAQALADMIFKHKLGSWIMLSEAEEDQVGPDDELVVGVGDIIGRVRLYEKFRHHKMAFGIQIMEGAIVYESADLGHNVLVNTGAQIDHDCIIGDHCVISPGAILCGNVTLGEACFIGAGAIILQGATLKAETYVPAGTLVVSSDDYRKPVRVVRRNGADRLATSPLTEEDIRRAELAHHGVCPNLQSPRDPVGTGFAIDPKADLSEP